jgi:hypothetical protein
LLRSLRARYEPLLSGSGDATQGSHEADYGLGSVRANLG